VTKLNQCLERFVILLHTELCSKESDDRSKHDLDEVFRNKLFFFLAFYSMHAYETYPHSKRMHSDIIQLKRVCSLF